MKTGIDAADNNGNTCCFAKFFLLVERVVCFQNFLIIITDTYIGIYL